MLTCHTLSTAMSVLALALLPGCASTLPAEVCRIEADAQLPQLESVANPLSNPAGAVTGAGLGALSGGTWGPAAIIAVPLGGLLGAGMGAACADAASRHPSAEADVKMILATVDIGLLKQALDVELAKPRAACQPAKGDTPASALPDAVFKIEKLEVRTGCLFGEQKYSVTVRWRILSARGTDVIAASAQTCSVTSSRSVDDWFADPVYARTEIGHLLWLAGRRIGALPPDPIGQARCAYRSREDGELEQQR
jgi:hypothetical protein